MILKYAKIFVNETFKSTLWLTRKLLVRLLEIDDDISNF